MEDGILRMSHRLWPGLALVVLFGCGGAGTERVAVGLAEALPTAELHRELAVLDLGTVEARPHLGSGWSGDETRRDGLTMVWAVGEVSEVTYFLAATRDLDVDLRCSPVEASGGETQRLVVEANGHRVTELELPRGLRTHRFRIPAEAAVVGANSLTLSWGHVVVPSDQGGSDDDRRLAARCDLIGFPGIGEVAAAEARGSDLVIRAGSQLDFFFAVPSSAVIETDGVEGSDGARIELSWQIDRSAEEPLGVWKAGEEARAMPVSKPSRGPLRIGLRAVGGDVVLRNPRARWEPSSKLADDPHEAHHSVARPNVLVYLVDTLRADRLGCYGWSEDLSPHLDRLAREGVLFRRTIAQSSWTKPSVVSILTGSRPGRHGVNGKKSKLPESAHTMAEILADNGYATAGFACNAYITRPAGFDQGFEDFSFRPVRSSEITEDVIEWLRDHPGDRPFFLYVHTVDPHAPYDPPESYRSRFAGSVTDPSVGTVRHIRGLASGEIPVTDEVVEDLLQLYGAEVAENDHSFGRLLASLDELGRMEDTLIIYLSDHGEEFREHGVLGHGWDLHGEVLHVPLVIRPPGGTSPTQVDGVTQHVDLLPTILEAVGVEPPEAIEGDSLWPVIAGRSSAVNPRPVYSYMDYEGRRGMAVELDGFKLIEPLSPGFLPARQLFPTAVDPEERHSVADVYPVTAGYLASLVRSELSNHRPRDASEQLEEFDTDTRRALEALGYIR